MLGVQDPRVLMKRGFLDEAMQKMDVSSRKKVRCVARCFVAFTSITGLPWGNRRRRFSPVFAVGLACMHCC